LGLGRSRQAQGTEAAQALAFADCLRMLYQRIGIFVSLPFDKLSKLSLQQQLDEIGRTEAATTKQSPADRVATSRPDIRRGGTSR